MENNITIGWCNSTTWYNTTWYNTTWDQESVKFKINYELI
jgi:hypothetical protein